MIEKNEICRETELNVISVLSEISWYSFAYDLDFEESLSVWLGIEDCTTKKGIEGGLN